MRKQVVWLLSALWIGEALAEVHDPMEPRGGTFAPVPFEEPAPWKEQSMNLPPYPQEGNLVEFPMTAGDYRYLVDTQSLAVGTDRAVRYTVVVVSTSGARSVFHEALRCDTGEYETIAYGRGDSFQKMHDPAWHSSSDASVSSAMGRFRKGLGSTVLCDEASRPRTPAEMVKHLRYP